MKQLISIRHNTHYDKKGKENPEQEEEYKRYTELVLLLDKATYSTTNNGEVILERGIEECRFTLSDKAFEQFIAALQEIKNRKD